MESERNSIIYQSCRTVLRPLASMLLRCGMTWKEFSDLSKSIFVQAATEEFGIKGRPTNVSRASILTGISRKEVKRQRDLLERNEPPVKGKTTDATRVLSAWFQDPEYLDSKSTPKLLKETGVKPSFESLCAAYGGDIAAPTMLKELLNTKTIERTEDGHLRVMRRYYQPAMHDDENLVWAVALIRDLTETMNNNVFEEKGTNPRFGGKADNVQVLAKSVSEFREFMDHRGQLFLEEIDDWLTNHQATDVTAEADMIRLGVGLFAIEDKVSMESSK